jgi:hypothetical protein
MKRGTWLVIFLVGIAVIAAIVAARFRRLEPRGEPATTTTAPISSPSTSD